MSLSKQHKLHRRRRGRNIGVGLSLAALIVIVLGLTVVKVTRGGLEFQPAATETSDGS